MTQTTKSVWDWNDRQKPTAEEQAKEDHKKQQRKRFNQLAQQESKRLTRLSQVPLQEKFNNKSSL